MRCIILYRIAFQSLFSHTVLANNPPLPLFFFSSLVFLPLPFMHVVFRPPRPGTPEMTKVKAPPSMAASHAAQGQIKQGKNDFLWNNLICHFSS